MTENGRSALRAAAFAALLLSTAQAPLRAQEAARREDAGPAAKEETVDAVRTRAGVLALVRTNPDAEMGLELRLDGRKVADVDGALYGSFKAHFRSLDAGEVVVMLTSDGGSGCPAQFRLIGATEAGKVSLTEEFGDCSDSPDITLRQLPEEEIRLRFPGYYRLSQLGEPGFRRPPPTTWVYRKGVLRKLKGRGKGGR
jgi:hypothetical protein